MNDALCHMRKHGAKLANTSCFSIDTTTCRDAIYHLFSNAFKHTALKILICTPLIFAGLAQVSASAVASTPQSVIDLKSKPVSSTLNEETSLLACFRLLRFSKAKAVKCFSVNVTEVMILDFALCVMSSGDINQCLPLLEKEK